MLQTIDHGPVRELRLARPPVNALSPELVSALDSALTEAATTARAVVLSGAPGMFSAGLDMKVLLTLDRPAMAAFWRSFMGLLERLATSPVPVVAAITGHSPAGGAVMAIFCDARIAADGDFRIGLNEVQVGMAMPPVIHAGLKRLVGTREAERLCVTGALVGPPEAQRIGLVDQVVPVDDVVPRAIAHCETLLKLPPRAMAATRELCHADFTDIFAALDEDMVERMNDGWFGNETQAVMKAVLAQLGAKSG